MLSLEVCNNLICNSLLSESLLGPVLGTNLFDPVTLRLVCYASTRLLHFHDIVRFQRDCYTMARLLHFSKIVTSWRDCYASLRLLHFYKIVTLWRDCYTLSARLSSLPTAPYLLNLLIIVVIIRELIEKEY